MQPQQNLGLLVLAPVNNPVFSSEKSAEYHYIPLKYRQIPVISTECHLNGVILLINVIQNGSIPEEKLYSHQQKPVKNFTVSNVPKNETAAEEISRLKAEIQTARQQIESLTSLKK